MTTTQKFQFNIRFILAVTAMVGGILALLRYASPYLLLPVVAIPFAFAVEFLTTGFGAIEQISGKSRMRRLAIVGGLSAFLAALSFGSLTAGYPTVLTPLPLLSVIPALYELSLGLIIGIPAVAFIVTIAPDIWLQREGLPVRFQFLVLVGTLASVYWFVTGWPYAIQYQSRGYAIGVVAVNSGAILVLWWFAWISRRSRSFATTIVFATALFLWLFTAAFPWMGELP